MLEFGDVPMIIILAMDAEIISKTKLLISLSHFVSHILEYLTQLKSTYLFIVLLVLNSYFLSIKIIASQWKYIK